MPVHRGVPHVDVCAGAGLELLAVEGEPDAAGMDEVQLLVARAPGLVVRLDDILSGHGRGVGVAAEGP